MERKRSDESARVSNRNTLGYCKWARVRTASTLLSERSTSGTKTATVNLCSPGDTSGTSFDKLILIPDRLLENLFTTV
eukprot:scaffold9546_cov157-Skeletonema_menzelii.AAC.8